MHSKPLAAAPSRDEGLASDQCYNEGVQTSVPEGADSGELPRRCFGAVLDSRGPAEVKSCRSGVFGAVIDSEGGERMQCSLAW